jgi:hypothetical protein
MSKRAIRRISNRPGLLTEGQNVAKVRFDLTQWQDFIDNHIPGLKSASGNIQFERRDEAFSFFNSRGSALLRGGGIEARIILLSIDGFDVTGPITDLP